MHGNLRVEADGVQRKRAGGLDVPLVLPGDRRGDLPDVRREELAEQRVERRLVEHAAGQPPDGRPPLEPEQRDVHGIRRSAVGEVAVRHDLAGRHPSYAGKNAGFNRVHIALLW